MGNENGCSHYDKCDYREIQCYFAKDGATWSMSPKCTIKQKWGDGMKTSNLHPEIYSQSEEDKKCQ